LDASIEEEGVRCGREEGCVILVVNWEGMDGTLFRNGRIYDDIDELQTMMSDILRSEVIVIKYVAALSSRHSLVVSHIPRRTGRAGYVAVIGPVEAQCIDLPNNSCCSCSEIGQSDDGASFLG
jgi:hypothetical protein